MLRRAVHPGRILKDELAALGVTPTELARQIDVPANRVSQIINGKRSITGDTALRLGHWFGVEPQFWLNLQAHLELVAADGETGDAIRLLPTSADLDARTQGPDPVGAGSQVGLER
ncbi:MAG: HigA family addiction module antidote protein [Alphaproteobacteria bacterium]|nr:HigA family addiction module antidote protein [Alphaproteobacteria bacterium]